MEMTDWGFLGYPFIVVTIFLIIIQKFKIFSKLEKKLNIVLAIFMGIFTVLGIWYQTPYGIGKIAVVLAALFIIFTNDWKR